jgi:oligosaccharide repeat unit polymerase
MRSTQYLSSKRKNSKFHLLMAVLIFVCTLFLVACLGFLFSATTSWQYDWGRSAILIGATVYLVIGVWAAFPHIFDLRTFRLPGILVAVYLGMLLLPAPWIYADSPGFARDAYLAILIVSLLFTVAGVVAVELVYPTPHTQIQTWMLKHIQICPGLKWMLVGLLLFCLLILSVYLLSVGTLPVIQALRGGRSSLELAQSREDAFKLLPHALKSSVSYLRTMLFPFSTLMLFVVTLHMRHWYWRLTFLLSLSGNLLLAGATLEKSPVMALIVILSITWFIDRGRRISSRSLLLIGLCGLAFPIFVLFAISGFNAEWGRVADNLVYRIFYAPTQVVLAYVDYFANGAPFLYGRTLPIISKYLPGGTIWIENIISMRYFYSGIDSGNANAGYPAYLWADFGWIGVVIGAFWAGVALQIVQAFIVRLPKSPPTMALQSILVWQTLMLSSLSFAGWFEWLVWEMGFVLFLLLISNVKIKRYILANASENSALRM